MAVPRTPLSLALAVVAAVALAGCTSSSQSTSAGSAASDGAGGSGAAAAPAAGEDAKSAASRPASGAAPAAAVKQRVIRTAQVVVRVDGELAPAAAKVRAVAQGLGGSVGSETTTFADARDPGTTVDGSTSGSTDGDASPSAPSAPSAPAAGKAAHPGQSLLVLRVPESSIDKALTLISGPGGVGKELSRAATAQDVTGDLADLQSRVATQRASVARVRALLGKAASLRDVVMLESEVTKREADLEALEARQAALADRADMATLTVDLRTAEAAVTVAQAEQRNAFLDGLDSGWKALTASLTVILTILGALLPLAILAAILGAPALWVLRRRRRTPVRPARPAPAPTAGGGN